MKFWYSYLESFTFEEDNFCLKKSFMSLQSFWPLEFTLFRLSDDYIKINYAFSIQFDVHFSLQNEIN
jgi:hypothetical protein